MAENKKGVGNEISQSPNWFIPYANMIALAQRCYKNWSSIDAQQAC